jgi:opacity protein-like surface antigen
MKKWIFIIGAGLLSISGFCQNVALKSNLLFDATTTINLGLEYALSDKLTLDVGLNYNPWVFPQKEIDLSGKIIEEYDGKFKHFMLQPELRWWPCEKFNRHFVGVHAHYINYNIGGLSFLPDGWGDGWEDPKGVHHDDGIQHKRFEGWGGGTGVSYGYHWLLSSRFSLEFTFGVGYTYLKYSKFDCAKCSKEISKSKMHYFGPSKAGISVIFMLK